MARFQRALLLGAWLVSAGYAPAQSGSIRGVHDPAIARSAGAYWIFSTGVRRDDTIFIRRSADLHSWSFEGEVFDALPAWTAELEPRDRNIWAPDISFFGGQWRLYYSVSSFGTNRSAIGLVENATLDPGSAGHAWIDCGKVIESRPGIDDWNAIDPHIIVDGGIPWLAFGSYWSGIKMLRIDPETGKPSAEDTTLHSLASRPGSTAIEAPWIIRALGAYWLFVSFDQCCRGSESTYHIVVGRADRVTGPYRDRDGTPMLSGGGTPVLRGYGRYRGPGHCAVLQESGRDWLVHHYYDLEENGVAKLQVRPLLWPADGWPIAGEPIPGPPPTRGFEPDATGTWEHRVDFADSAGTIRLLSNGRTNDPSGEDSWSLEGARLTLEWPRDGAPGGAWIDSCAISIDGSTYAGRNQNGTPVLGRRVPGAFLRGDATSNGVVDISDAVFTLLHLFGETRPIHCTKALDANDDGKADVADAVFLLDWLFRRGASIPPPSGAAGTDPTPDGLGC
jgi:arabinan endo-1,5-alpha-L-arabinosidase